MSNASFTRDEVILALDVLYFSGAEHLTKNSPEIIELCQLLQELPIHPKEGRPEIFRNESGVSRQIQRFVRSNREGIKDSSIGEAFYRVNTEFEGRLTELHRIAQAIKKNCVFFKIQHDIKLKSASFTEGLLLTFLHDEIEERDQPRSEMTSRCSICCLDLGKVYSLDNSLIQNHLAVPVLELDYKKEYTSDHFIRVCPNCHAALHSFRPWRTKQESLDILR